jgi:8-hydroxy-5-deazaflavin:NADPH oxidoreductase
MKIGILGSGDVAKSLAGGFLKYKHEVKLGSRTPAKLAEWKSQTPGATTGTFAEAAAFGELIVLAVKGNATDECLRAADIKNLTNKTIIDATNPIEEAPPVNGVLKFFTNPNESHMEVLQREFNMAHFVKAFNSVGADLMVNPHFKEGKPTMFICGNNDQAKKTVAKILDDFGWETADMGKAPAAQAIEPLCILWCIPGFLRNEWNHAFKLLIQK